MDRCARRGIYVYLYVSSPLARTYIQVIPWREGDDRGLHGPPALYGTALLFLVKHAMNYNHQMIILMFSSF